MVLGDHGIIDQGNWQSIKNKAGAIAKFSLGRQSKDNAVVAAAFDKLGAQVRAKDEAEADFARQSGASALYSDITLFSIVEHVIDMSAGYYLRFVGLKNIFLLITCTATYSFFITIPQYYLQVWTNSSGSSTVSYVFGFLFLSFVSWISTSSQMW